MACVCGHSHTICLSDEGVVYSFGHNVLGQLGHGDTNSNRIPTPISTLPRIKIVSCGDWFTVCVDYEGIMWSFGDNDFGQLGTGDKNKYLTPQKITNIPPVSSISCGNSHTLIITNDFNLWSVGDNEKGQLCLENNIDQLKPQQTSFSNINQIAAGDQFSLFQNYEKEIFGCGSNLEGQLGLGYSCSEEITVCKLPIPSSLKIIQFSCGKSHSLFLDMDGIVFSVGYNNRGNLGLGCYKDKDKLTQIPNIPPISYISCMDNRSYLLDVDGYVWAFGENNQAQLGLGDTTNRNVPIKIDELKNIQQLSSGCAASHFLVKDFHDTIFATGKNDCGQLGPGASRTTFGQTHIDVPIWGTTQKTTAKSARK